MIILDNNYFSLLKKNEDRYVKQKLYFCVNILPRVVALIKEGVIDEFKINLADSPYDDEDFIEFVKGESSSDFSGVVYKDVEYSISVEVNEEDETAAVKSTYDKLVSAISDKKFKFLQDSLSEFFENINIKYIRGYHDAFKANGRLNDMFGIVDMDKVLDKTTIYQVDTTDASITKYFYDCCKCGCSTSSNSSTNSSSSNSSLSESESDNSEQTTEAE